jgi:RNA polymerase sigma-70 factor (ECF subfamily)
MQEDERSLVERARSDPEAFGLLYDRYVAGVYRFARSRLPDDAAAEDVTAEAFLKALRGLGSYRDQGRPFGCWLYRIAGNVVADHFRHEPASLQLGDHLPSGGVSTEEQAIRNDEIGRVWYAVEKLPAQQRMAMILKFRDDRSLPEVGALMGKSEAAAKLLIYRAMVRLRSELARVPELHAPAPAALPAI